MGTEPKVPFGPPNECKRFSGHTIEWAQDGTPDAISFDCSRYKLCLFHAQLRDSTRSVRFICALRIYEHRERALFVRLTRTLP